MNQDTTTYTFRPAIFAVVFLSVFAVSVVALADGNELRVDVTRLNATMQHMKTFGINAAGGSDRVAYSSDNRDALAYLSSLMLEAGLEAKIDVAGNLVGRRAGKVAGLAPVITGSHVDTVPNGGHYDGIVGAMAAIEVARTLHEAEYVTDHPLEIIVWSNEEGGKTGSRSFNGSVKPAEFALPSLGEKSLGEGIRYIGGDPENILRNVRQPGEVAALIDLHIEQGAILDKEDISIGVVEGIVGIKRWNVSVDGFANHAGTTPMDQRQDAMYTAALVVAKIREIIIGEPGRQVGTVGRIRAYPGAPNVIPGKVTFSLEIRDLDMAKIDRLFGLIQSSAVELAENNATKIQFEHFYTSPAAITDERFKTLINDSADSLGLSSMHMPSGAGHDAQSLGGIAPLGMIFVPSKDGTSHAPSEFTSEQQITDGANVLLQTIIGLDGVLE
ncbi:MAG: Zn-dependent hydrolase [Gammaproteobacteria bacterium]|nr:MAG: Zn-dependent hydrolase [Gammaproteobacteria bacterium]